MRYEGAEPVPHTASSELGTDNERLFGDLLGLSKAEIAQLKREDVI